MLRGTVLPLSVYTVPIITDSGPFAERAPGGFRDSGALSSAVANWYDRAAMLPDYGRLGPLTFRTYTVLLNAAILLGLAVLVWHGRREGRPVAWLDVGLASLAGGLIGGRLAHVALSRAYFLEHPAEIAQVWRGGLDWHAAVVVGLAALYAAARWQGVSWHTLTDALAPVLPAGALLTYVGCLPAGCSAGLEVATLADYPPLVAAELPDVYGLVAPRLSSQLFGIALSVVLLVLAWALGRWARPGVRFWPVLALLALGVFGIGFTLDGGSSPMLGGLRLDQLLDLSVAALAAVISLAAVRVRPGPEPSPAAVQGVSHAD